MKAPAAAIGFLVFVVSLQAFGDVASPSGGCSNSKTYGQAEVTACRGKLKGDLCQVYDYFGNCRSTCDAQDACLECLDGDGNVPGEGGGGCSTAATAVGGNELGAFLVAGTFSLLFLLRRRLRRK